MNTHYAFKDTLTFWVYTKTICNVFANSFFTRNLIMITDYLIRRVQLWEFKELYRVN